MLILLAGRKTVTLVADKHHQETYVDAHSQSPPLDVISPIQPDTVDLLKYPKFAKAPYARVEMKAGKA